MENHIISNGKYYISTNKDYLDVLTIHKFLSDDSYWAKGISKKAVEATVHYTPICYGVFDGNPEQKEAKQIGFARVVTDFVRYAWLGDVFILPEYRGKGLSKWLIASIFEHPQLKGVSFNLSTKDAHGLYSQFGFERITDAEKRMVRPMNLESINHLYRD
ncbi:GNAT family N-acetyltransferase [Peribacillus alkalitolerans]|uniref:GNAT family N-acetyltransferase n=1 Tax=Peribacillus alkalitolerans TaxID=1550385 RepID=UPI0013D541A3|nr:GNAT family N-acetyltransferase [Peribacillus alkalitolerans]